MTRSGAAALMVAVMLAGVLVSMAASAVLGA